MPEAGGGAGKKRRSSEGDKSGEGIDKIYRTDSYEEEENMTENYSKYMHASKLKSRRTKQQNGSGAS